MKRILFLLTFVAITLCGMAQRLDFDGIPVNQNVSTFEAALLKAGATRQSEFEQSYEPNRHIFFYIHLGERCVLHVVSDNAGKVKEVTAEYAGSNETNDKQLLTQLSSRLRSKFSKAKCFEGRAHEHMATIVLDPIAWEFTDGAILASRSVLPGEQEYRFVNVRYNVGENMGVANWPDCNNLPYNGYLNLAATYIQWSSNYEKAQQIASQWRRKTPYGALVHAYTCEDPLEDLNFACKLFTSEDHIALRKAKVLLAYYYLTVGKPDMFEQNLIHAIMTDTHFDEDIAECLGIICQASPAYINTLKEQSKDARFYHLTKYIDYLTTGKKPQNEPYEESSISQFNLGHWIVNYNYMKQQAAKANDYAPVGGSVISTH